MSQQITVRKVESRDDYRAFFNLPWTIYRDDPNWVPPLVSMRRDVIAREKNPAWDYLEGDYFVAWRGEQPVGTVAAFVNHRHNEFHREKVAWFGAFETVDDPAIGHALLNTAVTWAKDNGYPVLRGPQTFTTHEEVGLLVDGAAPPVLLMPYHRNYYQSIIETAGFDKALDIFSYYYDWDMVAEGNLTERLNRIAERLQKRGGFSIRPIDRNNLRHEFELFKELYNRAWVANWGFVPMTDKELDVLIEGLSLIFDPDLACFAVADNGDPIAFMICVPDFNQVLIRASARPGMPEPITLLRALWHWKVRRVIDGVRVPLMGVVPEYQNKGVDILMYHYAFNILANEKPYKWIDCGWILENNHDMRGILEGIGMKIHRTYRLYEKPIER